MSLYWILFMAPGASLPSVCPWMQGARGPSRLHGRGFAVAAAQGADGIGSRGAPSALAAVGTRSLTGGSGSGTFGCSGTPVLPPAPLPLFLEDETQESASMEK